MLMIRFQRTGRTNDASFRIVVLERARAAKAGAIVEQLGTYNPHSKALTLSEDRVKHWLSVGAQATGSIHNLLVSKGLVAGKKINVLPKKSPIKKEGEAAPAVEAAAPASEATPETELPSEAEVMEEAAAPTESVGEEAPVA
jgi:small subunit ribosomal protein S16